MTTLKTLLRLSILAVVSAKSCHGSKIHWAACNSTEFNTTLPIDCGTVTVPLDYTDTAANRTIPLEVLRLRAPIQPAKGSILLNFGGPGAPARHDVLSLGPRLLALSGGQYNLVAFDPRGTGSTIPLKCTANPRELADITAQMELAANASDAAIGKTWAVSTIAARKCFLNANETGRLLSTAFVARDLISTVDALGEDGMLRFWGFSYGTTLGATVIAMFPDRIDKVIIDGVQNPHDYYNDYVTAEQWADADATFSQMFQWCANSPGVCAMAKNGLTANQLEQSAWDMFEKIKYRPFAVGDLLFTYGLVKSITAGLIKDIEAWPLLLTIYDLILTKNLETLEIIINAILQSFSSTGQDPLAVPVAIFGIQCGDNKRRAGSLDEILPSIYREMGSSRLMGDLPTYIRTICAQWKLEPKERYNGDFRSTPKNPVLIMGNTYDTHTPIRSAHNVSASINGSVVVEVKGYGHCSISSPSSCGLKVMSEYWVNGTLPKAGTTCEVEGKPFSGIGWDQIFQAAAGNKTITKRDLHSSGVIQGLSRGWWLR